MAHHLRLVTSGQRLRLLLAVGLLCAVPWAQAADPPGQWRSSPLPNGLTLTISPNGGTIIEGATKTIAGNAGGASITRNGNLTVPGGSIAVQMGRGFSGAAVARAAARALPYVSVGFAVYDLFDSVRCRPVVAQAFGGECDDGQPEEDVAVWLAGGNWGDASALSYGSSPTGACSQAIGKIAEANPSTSNSTYAYSRSYTFAGATTSTCMLHAVTSQTLLVNGQVYPGADYTTNIGMAQTTTKACPDGGLKFADGKCPTGNWAPKTEAELQAKAETAAVTGMPAGKNWGDILREADQKVDVDPLATTRSLTGPATKQGAPSTSTTTGPNGQVSTTTTATTNITYNSTASTVIWNITNNTTKETTKPDGTTETEVTEETPPEEEDPCAIDSSRVGCLKVGDAPDVPFDPTEKPVAFTPESGFGADNAACPAPLQIATTRGTYSLSLQPVCDFGAGIRALVIGLAALGGAMIFLGGARGS